MSQSFTDVLLEIAKPAPHLVALIILVMWFLRHLSADRKARADDLACDREARASEAKATRETLRELGQNCHEAQRILHEDHKQLTETMGGHLEASTAALAQNTIMLQQLSPRTRLRLQQADDREELPHAPQAR